MLLKPSVHIHKRLHIMAYCTALGRLRWEVMEVIIQIKMYNYKPEWHWKI